MYQLCTLFDFNASSSRSLLHRIDDVDARRLVTCFLSPLGAADCAVCAKGFAPGISYSCRECSRDITRSAVGLALVVGLAVLLFAGALLTYLGKGVHDGAEGDRCLWNRKCRSCRDSLGNMLPMRAIKIVVTVWQIISQVYKCSLPHDMPT